MRQELGSRIAPIIAMGSGIEVESLVGISVAVAPLATEKRGVVEHSNNACEADPNTDGFAKDEKGCVE